MTLMNRLNDLATTEDGQLHALRDDRGQVATIIAVVTVGIVAVIGILIFSQVLGAIGDPSTIAAANRTELENATVSTADGFGDAMNLIPVVLIVLVASLVIGVVQRFG